MATTLTSALTATTLAFALSAGPTMRMRVPAAIAPRMCATDVIDATDATEVAPPLMESTCGFDHVRPPAMSRPRIARDPRTIRASPAQPRAPRRAPACLHACRTVPARASSCGKGLELRRKRDVSTAARTRRGPWSLGDRPRAVPPRPQVPLAVALQTGDFLEADQITRDALIKLAGEKAVGRGYVYFTDVAKLPEADLVPASSGQGAPKKNFRAGLRAHTPPTQYPCLTDVTKLPEADRVAARVGRARNTQATTFAPKNEATRHVGRR